MGTTNKSWLSRQSPFNSRVNGEGTGDRGTVSVITNVNESVTVESRTLVGQLVADMKHISG